MSLTQSRECALWGASSIPPLLVGCLGARAGPPAGSCVARRHRRRTSGPGRPGANLRSPAARAIGRSAVILGVDEAMATAPLSRPGPGVVLHGEDRTDVL